MPVLRPRAPTTICREQEKTLPRKSLLRRKRRILQPLKKRLPTLRLLPNGSLPSSREAICEIFNH